MNRPKIGRHVLVKISDEPVGSTLSGGAFAEAWDALFRKIHPLTE